MIVWVASFPRSGNTFFRIVLHELYSVNTYTGFLSGDDLEADIGRSDLTGHCKLPKRTLGKELHRNSDKIKHLLKLLDSESEIYFIKTHNLPSELWDSQFKAILLVRDGRDAAISFAHYLIDIANTIPRLKKLIKEYIKNGNYLSITDIKFVLTRTYRSSLVFFAKRLRLEKTLFNYLLNGFLTQKGPWCGRWTLMNSEWLDRKNAETAVIRFEDLINNPQEFISQALNELGINLLISEGNIPTFSDLKKLHPHFFRSGQTGEWESEINEELNEKFWEVHGNMMSRLGYLKTKQISFHNKA